MEFKTAFDFLKKLVKNNNRDWFEKNKPAFLSIKESFEEFITEVHHEMCSFDPSLTGLDPKKLVFRIYRDVRFSKDKKPYKSHLSAGISSQGKGMGAPGYYIQIEPGNKSFVGIGLYAPDAEKLSKVRQEIDYSGDELKKIVGEKKFKKLFGDFWDGDSLKTMPKGYPKDHPNIKWLKLRSYIVMHSFSDEEVLSKKFSKDLINALQVAKPLNDFLLKAMD